MIVLFTSLLSLFCFGYYILIRCYAGKKADFSVIWILFGVWNLLLSSLPSPLQEVLFAVLFLALLIPSIGIFCDMFQSKQPPLPYIIILGAQVRGRTPTRSLLHRLDTARAYLEQHPQTIAVLSGGKGPGEDITEADAMYLYLRRSGISARRLIKENRSTSTKENLLFSQTFITSHQPMGIVSNNFHIHRAKKLAKKLGYEQIYGIPAPAGPVLFLHFFVREIFAIGKELLSKNI